MSFLTGKGCPGKMCLIVDHHIKKFYIFTRTVRKANLNAISDKNET